MNVHTVWDLRGQFPGALHHEDSLVRVDVAPWVTLRAAEWDEEDEADSQPTWWLEAPGYQAVAVEDLRRLWSSLGEWLRAIDGAMAALARHAGRRHPAEGEGADGADG